MAATEAGRTIFVEGPSGPPLRVVSETDVRLEAAQLTPETQVYYGEASHGLLTLKPGAVVVDVGGNVGSFARLAARVAGATGKVYSVEPIPEVYRALEENCRTFHDFYADQASDGSHGPKERQPAVIVPVHAGVVPNPGSGFEEFVFFPRCAALSTQAQHRDDADAMQCTCSIVMNGQGNSTTWLQAVARGLARAMPWVYVPIHSTVSKGILLGGARHVSCPVMTLSDLIDKYDIERIDLLKINVERGELGVLQSVRPEHWPRIRQVSMQLHDRQGALDQASQLLRAAGLKRIKVFKEPRFQSCCLVQVYARR